MYAFWREVRDGFGRLARNPTTSIAALLTMGLGIGVVTAAYSVVDGLMLRGVAFEEPERLVALRRVHLSGPRRSTSVPEADFLAWCDQQQSFEALIGFRSGAVNLRDAAPFQPGLPERYTGAWVSPGFLDLLRVDPLLGRGLEPADAAVGAEPVVLIGERIWRDHWGGSTALIGRTIRVDGRPATVVGVLPRDFRFPGYGDVWLPLVLPGHALAPGQGRGLEVIGRLKEDVPLARAALEMATIAQRLAAAHPETHEGMGVVARSYVEHIVSDYMGDDGLLMATGTLGVPALIVLLIACVNVTNLLLARVGARTRDLAIRSALGCGRARIVGQVLTEAGLLALGGALLGVALAWPAVRAYAVAMSAVEQLPYWVRFDVDNRALVFAAGASVVSALAAGIAPALRASRADVVEVLHEAARGTTGFGLGWLSRSLAILALTLSCALAVAAGLSVRSALAVQSHQPRFDAARVLTARLGLVEDAYPEPADRRRLYAQLLERVAARPGVVAAAVGTAVPSDTQLASGFLRYLRPGEVYEGWWQMPGARSAVVSPGYFEALGVHILVGRDFGIADRPGGPFAVIVNEDLARREWPDESPIGQRLQLWLGRDEESGTPRTAWAEVVGLAPALRFAEFSNEDDQQAIYLPLAQHPPRSAIILARTRTDPTAFTETLRRTVQGVDADLSVFFVRSMDQVLEATLFFHRLVAVTFVVLGAAALLLAAVGLYGVSFAGVVQRIPEMGVRLALGASPGGVVGLIVHQGLVKTAAGLGVGLALGWGLGKALESYLFRVRPEDPVTLGAVPVLLMAVSCLAHLLPALQAARTDPVAALRRE